MTRTADRIEAEADDREIRRAALSWKLKLLTDLQQDLVQKEPLRMLVDSWALWMRVSRYLGAGEGRDLFGPWQPIAVATASEILLEVERLARAYIPADRQTEVVRQINTYAREHPIRGVFQHETVRDFGEAEEGRSIVERLLHTPFRALGRVAEGLEPTARLAQSVDRFTQLMSDYPPMLRWQLQMLLLDFERLSSVEDTVESLKRAADAAAAFTAMAETLPERLRAESRLLLDDFDERQPGLRTTLGEARQTIAAADEAIAQAEDLALRVSEVTSELTRAGETWTETAAAVKVAVEQIQQFGKGRSSERVGARENPTAPAGEATPTTTRLDETGVPRPGFDVRDYTRTAEAMREATVELRLLLAEFDEFAQGNAIERSTSQAGALADDVLVGAEGRMRGVVDHAFWRALQLVLIILALVVAYRVVGRRASAT